MYVRGLRMLSLGQINYDLSSRFMRNLVADIYAGDVSIRVL